MKILHIVSSPRAEGTPRLVLSWLSEPGWDHEVYALSSAPADLSESFTKQAAWFKAEPEIPTGKKKFPWIVAKVRQVCRERRPDLVVCWPNGFGAWVLLGARLAGTQRLITHGGNPPTWTLKGKCYTAFTTAMLKLVGGRMVCCSHYVGDEFARVPGVIKSVLRTVVNCVPVESVRARAVAARARRHDARPCIIMVATLEAHKDHATLLRAMPRVLRAVPEAELLLAGEGSLRRKLEALTQELGVESSVRFLGARNDIPELLGQSDVFVLATTPQEGMPTVLLEAMAAGARIVASDVRPCRETLEDGRWGRMVPPANPEAMAAALIGSLQKPRHIEAEQALLEYLEHFHPSKMIEAYFAAAS